VQKFSAAVIFLIFIIMVTVSALIISHQRSVLKAEMDDHHGVIVRSLAKDAVEPLLLLDPLRLDELVRTTAQVPGCAYAGALDHGGRIVAHTDRKLLGGQLSPVIPAEDADDARGRDGHIRDLPAAGIKEILVPVTVGFQDVGTVYAGFSRESTDLVIENNLQRLKNHIFLVSGLVMLIGIWGAYGLARLLATPIKRLKEKMVLVQSGDLDVSVPNDDLLNCWEVLSCDMQDCPSYGKQRCWTISGTKCFGRLQGDASEKICDCKKCIVYRESCGDEVGELVEVFNQMVGDLKCNLRELEESNQEKYRLDRLSALGQIAAGVAHEINNPLGGISLCFNNLIKTEMDEDTRRQHIEVINSGFDRIKSIVKRLLDFSKDSSLSVSRASVNSIVRNVLKLSEYTISAKGITLVQQLSGNVPDIMADPVKLEQVLLNLVINAVQAMEGGGVLTIRTGTDGPACRVCVSDTGKGIPRDILAKIFDPFFTTKDPGEGTGLGLSVSKAIIEQHKGEIQVETSEKGATFIVRLPLSL